ncbi:TonB-dependent receptor domain-containing protein, partial [Methylomonas koyamae]|uniref:TonB-dependent receptor domain-containing protein n=1 Tax=Methylomonas koyamae TaxID=702114 RepID=UPI00210F6316
ALAGARWTNTTSQVADGLTNVAQPQTSVSRVTPQYGLLYKITPEWTAFATYAESFVPATFLVNNLDAAAASPNRARAAASTSA